MLWLKSLGVVTAVLLCPLAWFVLAGHHLQRGLFAGVELGLVWASATAVVVLGELRDSDDP